MCEEIERRIDLPLVLDHDTAAARLAEWWLGGGRTSDFQTMVYMVGGRGVGVGIVYDGHLVRGTPGTAGEIGHHTIQPAGPPCECGTRGCLELFCSTRAMLTL